MGGSTTGWQMLTEGASIYGFTNYFSLIITIYYRPILFKVYIVLFFNQNDSPP